MEKDNNQVDAQAMLIHDNPFRHISIGDSVIDWVSSDGDPSSVAGAFISGNAAWTDTDDGVTLTPASDTQAGYLHWVKTFDYTKDLLITATTKAGGGDGADGITIFFGCDDVSSAGDAEGGINVYFNEFDNDIIQTYKNGVLVSQYSAFKTLDDNTYNEWQLVYQWQDADNIFLHIFMNGRYIGRDNLAPWTSAGGYIGISGVCGSNNNVHAVKAFAVKSANVWLNINPWTPPPLT